MCFPHSLRARSVVAASICNFIYYLLITTSFMKGPPFRYHCVVFEKYTPLYFDGICPSHRHGLRTQVTGKYHIESAFKAILPKHRLEGESGHQVRHLAPSSATPAGTLCARCLCPIFMPAIIYDRVTSRRHSRAEILALN